MSIELAKSHSDETTCGGTTEDEYETPAIILSRRCIVVQRACNCRRERLIVRLSCRTSQDVLNVRRIGLRYGYLSDAVVGEFDVHAVAVVAEDLYLVLVDDVATVTADEVLAKLVLNGFGSAAQHVVA